MNNLSCILNCQTFMEAIVIGIITLILGKIIFNLSINKKNKNEKQPITLDISFFITGFILHFFIEIIGLNQWYCDKKCRISQYNLAKLLSSN
jgi:Kef-type K+ transport system membrane component KefB